MPYITTECPCLMLFQNRSIPALPVVLPIKSIRYGFQVCRMLIPPLYSEALNSKTLSMTRKITKRSTLTLSSYTIINYHVIFTPNKQHFIVFKPRLYKKIRLTHCKPLVFTKLFIIFEVLVYLY